MLALIRKRSFLMLSVIHQIANSQLVKTILLEWTQPSIRKTREILWLYRFKKEGYSNNTRITFFSYFSYLFSVRPFCRLHFTIQENAPEYWTVLDPQVPSSSQKTTCKWGQNNCELRLENDRVFFFKASMYMALLVLNIFHYLVVKSI